MSEMGLWIAFEMITICGLGARETEDSPLLNVVLLNVRNVYESIGDWFSSCEENIILHTLQSVRSCCYIFCFPSLTQFCCYFFLRRSSRLNFNMNAKSSLCAPESQILFLSTSVENTELACYHSNIFKNRLSVLGWVLQWCCSFRLHCSLLICGWVWMSWRKERASRSAYAYLYRTTGHVLHPEMRLLH